MISDVMLYRPLMDEIYNDDVKQLYGEMYGNKIKVDIIKCRLWNICKGWKKPDTMWSRYRNKLISLMWESNWMPWQSRTSGP